MQTIGVASDAGDCEGKLTRSSSATSVKSGYWWLWDGHKRGGGWKDRWMWPYHQESTWSRPISEVKPGRASPVLRWEITREPLVLHSFLLVFLWLLFFYCCCLCFVLLWCECNYWILCVLTTSYGHCYSSIALLCCCCFVIYLVMNKTTYYYFHFIQGLCVQVNPSFWSSLFHCPSGWCASSRFVSTNGVHVPSPC